MHPYAAPTPLEPSALTDLNARLDELEEHIADEKSSQPTTSPPADPSPQLLATVRKSFQPELDAISRAVRRYEKRATVLGMQMEGRMQELEYRVKDALTLAAAAERGRDGSAKILLDFVSAMVVVPATAGWAAGIWAINMPVRLLEKTKTMLPGASKSKGKARESGKRKKKDNS